MGYRSSFTRRDTPNGAVFDVDPAWPSIAMLIFVVPFSLWVLYEMLTGDKMLFWILLIIPAPIIAVAWLFITLDFRRRKRVKILASPKGLKVGNKAYPAEDIRELQVVGGRDEGPVYTSNMVVVGAGAGGMAAAATLSAGAGIGEAARASGRAIGEAQAGKSFAVALRRKSVSKPVLLVFGLTEDTARDLMDDLVVAMR